MKNLVCLLFFAIYVEKNWFLCYNKTNVDDRDFGGLQYEKESRNNEKEI